MTKSIGTPKLKRNVVIQGDQSNGLIMMALIENGTVLDSISMPLHFVFPFINELSRVSHVALTTPKSNILKPELI